MHYFIDQNLKKIVTLQVDQTMQCNAIVVQPLSQKQNKKRPETASEAPVNCILRAIESYYVALPKEMT